MSGLCVLCAFLINWSKSSGSSVSKGLDKATMDLKSRLAC